MNLEKLSFDNISDLKKVMRIPLEKIDFVSAEQMVKIMNSADEKITVHLYPMPALKRTEKCLLDYAKWSYHQIYLAIKEGKICCCIGHGNSSGARATHNHLIELILKNKKLQETIPTAVLVTFKGSIIAYYFNKKYAYLNQDLGSNWGRKICGKLAKSEMPFSEKNFPKNGGMEIKFNTKTKKTTIFKAVQNDGFLEKFMKKAMMKPTSEE